MNSTTESEMDQTNKVADDEVKILNSNEESTKVQYGFRSAFSQITAAVAQNVLLFSVGMILAMPTVIVGVLDHKIATNETRTKYPDLILSDEQSSWLGSILMLFHPLGSITSGCLQEIIGRKKIMIAVNIPFFAGWVILYYAESVNMLLMGTVTLGLGLGCCEAPILSYIGEICEPRMRGALSLLAGSAVSCGYLIEFIIFAFTDWRTTILLSAIFPVLSIVIITAIPESPIWLIAQGRLTQAEKSLRWLRGWSKKDKVLIEFEELVRYTNESSVYESPSIRIDTNMTLKSDQNLVKRDPNKQFIHSLKYLKRTEIIKAFKMIFILFFITLIASFQPMRPFLVEIFNTFGLPMQSEWILVLTGILSITGSFASVASVNKLGKRRMSLWSTALNFISSLALGVCAMNLHWPGWIPLTLLCISFWVSGYGMVPLPWMLLSEIFPIQVRGVACGISAASAYVIGFVSTKTYINISQWFGLHGTIFIYTFIGFIGFVYIYLYMPETEDRTLQEILDFFLSDEDARKFSKRQNKIVSDQNQNSKPQDTSKYVSS